MKKYLFLFGSFFALCLYMLITNSFSFVVKEGDKTYLVDRKGEHWDVTQAVSIGFIPENFEYGLGRNAFAPLDDRYLGNAVEEVSSSLRVIGVSEGTDARAYSTRKLFGHEIANSVVGSQPIAVGY